MLKINQSLKSIPKDWWGGRDDPKGGKEELKGDWERGLSEERDGLSGTEEEVGRNK